MRRFAHTIGIAASVDEVWAVLADLEGWSEWNMLEAAAPGGLRVGEVLQLRIPVGGVRIPARATLTHVTPGEELRWRGGVPGVFHAVHGFRLEPTPAGCEVTHDEEMRGLAVGAALRALGPEPADRYRAVNEGLKRIVESRVEL